MAIKTRETNGTGVTNANAPLSNAELDNNFIELVAEDANKLENVVEDTSPQLGGNLSTQNNDITVGTGNVYYGSSNQMRHYTDSGGRPTIHATTNLYLSPRGVGSYGVIINNHEIGQSTLKTAATFYPYSGQSLYYNGVNKFLTQAYGIQVRGDSTNGSGAIQLNCEFNTHGVKIKGPPHSAAASYTLTLPDDDGTNGQALTTDGSGGLSWTTITSGSSLTIKDEGSALATAATTLNFTGAGVIATGTGAEKTITISGGGGSGGSGVAEGKALVFANLFG